MSLFGRANLLNIYRNMTADGLSGFLYIQEVTRFNTQNFLTRFMLTVTDLCMRDIK